MAKISNRKNTAPSRKTRLRTNAPRGARANDDEKRMQLDHALHVVHAEATTSHGVKRLPGARVKRASVSKALDEFRRLQT